MMNIFFNKSVSETEKSEDIVKINKYEHIKELLGEVKITFSDGKKSYIVTADDLVDMQLSSYWAQREKDKNHITTISQGIKNSRGLYHPIILANIIPRKEFVILDGQHRYDALSYISKKQREEITLQVDVIDFEQDDDEWVLQNYEWINTSKGISKQDLDDEKKVALLVDQLAKRFKHSNGRKLIGDYVQKNKQNSRLNIKELKSELVKRLSLLKPHLSDIDKIISFVIDYNDYCNSNQELQFSKTRIGHKVKDECIERKFWLGVNFPNWIDEMVRNLN